MLHRTYSGDAQHILTCAQRLQGGGVERAMLRMADGWLKAGRRVTLVLGSREGPLAAEIPEGIELRELGNGEHSALFALADHVRQTAPDLIFCPGNHYTGIAALTRARLGTQSPPMVASPEASPVGRTAGSTRPAGAAGPSTGAACWATHGAARQSSRIADSSFMP